MANKLEGWFLPSILAYWGWSMDARRPDFSVSNDQIVNARGVRRPLVLDVVHFKSKGDKS